MKSKPSRVLTCAALLLTTVVIGNTSFAQEDGGKALPEESNLYMGAPVTLGKAPNGAIANKKLLDGIPKVARFEPTIEKLDCFGKFNHVREAYDVTSKDTVRPNRDTIIRFLDSMEHLCSWELPDVELEKEEPKKEDN